MQNPSAKADIVFSGTEVAISCDVDSNPKPEIMWTRGGSSAVLGRQQVYVIREMTSLDVGVYTCRASVEGFPVSLVTNAFIWLQTRAWSLGNLIWDYLVVSWSSRRCSLYRRLNRGAPRVPLRDCRSLNSLFPEYSSHDL